MALCSLGEHSIPGDDLIIVVQPAGPDLQQPSEPPDDPGTESQDALLPANEQGQPNDETPPEMTIAPVS